MSSKWALFTLGLLCAMLIAATACAFSGTYTGVSRSGGTTRVMLLKVKCLQTVCTVSAQMYMRKKGHKKTGLTVFGGVFSAGIAGFSASPASGSPAMIGSYNPWDRRWNIVVLAQPTIPFVCKCKNGCKPLCDASKKKKCVATPAPTATPTPAPMLSTGNWAGSWTCEGPGDASLTISGTGGSSSMRADFANAAYGPAHDEYVFKSVQPHSASGNYTYYNSAPPGHWPGTFSLTISGETIHLERQDSSSSWHGSYVCRRS